MSTTQLESQDAAKEQAGRKMFEALGEFLAMRQAVIDVGGTEGPLDQELIEKFGEMQAGVVDRAIEALAAGREAGWGQ